MLTLLSDYVYSALIGIKRISLYLRAVLISFLLLGVNACGSGGTVLEDVYPVQILPENLQLSMPESLVWRSQISEEQALRYLMQMVAESELDALGSVFLNDEQNLPELSSALLDDYPLHGFRGLTNSLYLAHDEISAVAHIAILTADFLLYQVCGDDVELCGTFSNLGMDITYIQSLRNSMDNVLDTYHIGSSSYEVPPLGYIEGFTVSLESSVAHGYQYAMQIQLPEFIDEDRTNVTLMWSDLGSRAVTVEGLAQTILFSPRNADSINWLDDGEFRLMTTQSLIEDVDNGITSLKQFSFEQRNEDTLRFSAVIEELTADANITYEWQGAGEEDLAVLIETVTVQFAQNTVGEDGEGEGNTDDSQGEDETNEVPETGETGAGNEDNSASSDVALDNEAAIEQSTTITPSQSYQIIARTVLRNTDIASQYYCLKEADGVEYDCGDTSEYTANWNEVLVPNSSSLAYTELFDLASGQLVEQHTIRVSNYDEPADRIYAFYQDRQICNGTLDPSDSELYHLLCWIEDPLSQLSGMEFYTRSLDLKSFELLTSIAVELYEPPVLEQ